MKLKELLLATFLAVLTAIGGILSIPLPLVPFTMQTFVVLMSGLMLGPKYGPLSQLLYILMGLIGLPVFAGGTGGLHSLLSPTFGFLVGFVFTSWIAGKLRFIVSTAQTDRKGFKIFKYGLICLAATVGLYAVGLPWFYVNMNFVAGVEISFWGTFKAALLPFIIPDAIKAAAAGILAERFQAIRS